VKGFGKYAGALAAGLEGLRGDEERGRGSESRGQGRGWVDERKYNGSGQYNGSGSSARFGTSSYVDSNGIRRDDSVGKAMMQPRRDSSTTSVRYSG
jgi:hypothetical protein